MNLKSWLKENKKKKKTRSIRIVNLNVDGMCLDFTYAAKVEEEEEGCETWAGGHIYTNNKRMCVRVCKYKRNQLLFHTNIALLPCHNCHVHTQTLSTK